MKISLLIFTAVSLFAQGTTVRYIHGPASTAAWTSATGADTALTIDVGNYGLVAVSFNPSGSITAGTLNFEVSDDGGTTYYPTQVCRKDDSVACEKTFSLNAATKQSWQASVAGYTQFRVRLNPVITGAGTANLRVQAQAGTMALRPVIGSYTIATLPSASPANRFAIVTNAGAPGRCDGTTGVHRSLCRSTGSIWRSVGDGASGTQQGDGVYVNSWINTSGSTAFGAQWWAQTFIPRTTHKLYGFGMRLGTLDFPLPSCTVSLKNSSAGRPGTTTHASKTFAAPSGIGGDFTKIYFDTPFTVTAGVTYTIVLDCTAATSGFPVSWSTTFAEDIFSEGDLFKSTDSGANWNKLTEAPDSLQEDEDGFFFEILEDISLPGQVPFYRTYTIGFASLTAAATTQDIALFTNPAKGKICGVTIKHTTAFAGTFTALTVSVGSPAQTTEFYASAFDIMQSTGNLVYQDSSEYKSGTEASEAVNARFTATGANLNTASAGSVDITVCQVIRP